MVRDNRDLLGDFKAIREEIRRSNKFSPKIQRELIMVVYKTEDKVVYGINKVGNEKLHDRRG